MKRTQILTYAIGFIVIGVAASFALRSCNSDNVNVPASKLSEVQTLANSTPKATNATNAVRVGTAEKLALNDQIEMPFLGRIKTHRVDEQVEFKAGGKSLKWPFKVHYRENGMFARAEFRKPGSKDHASSLEMLEAIYRQGSESLVGFPEKPPNLSLAKMLEILYQEEPFDKATQINISWVLYATNDNQSNPRFVVDVFGVSQGVMRVPSDREWFLRYRVLYDAEGNFVRIDNRL